MERLTLPRTVVGFTVLTFSATAALSAVPAQAPEIPLLFMENHGQADPSVRYLGTGPQFNVLFMNSGVAAVDGDMTALVSFENTASHPQPVADDQVAAHANYLVGNDPSQWRTDLPLFSTIRYSGLWPGIDLIWRAENGRFTAEYRLSPEADIGAVRLRVNGEPRVQDDGTLLVHTAKGDYIEQCPAFYRASSGGLLSGASARLNAAFQKNPDGTLSFVPLNTPPTVVPAHPAVLLSGYFGGSTEDSITALAIDSLNNIVVAGWTASPNLPTSAGYQKKYGGSVDAFVAAFLPNGGGLIYCTYLGGSGADEALGITLDSSRNVYVTGWTSSTNFPVLTPIRTHLGGTRDAFVTKLAAAGNALLYSTYLGGNGVDHAASVVVGASGGIFIGGYTWSTNFPVLNAQQPHSGGGQDGFVAKIGPNGNKFYWSTYIGGSGGSSGAPEEVTALLLDPSTNVIVGGTTSSTNFPVTSGTFQTSLNGVSDGFLARLSNSTGYIMQCTYIGGSLADSISAVTTDFYGYIYATGSTLSPDFPVQWPVQATNAGALDAFAVKMNTTLSTVLFSTYLGGTGSDQGNAIAVDGETSITVAGQTSSPNYPVTETMQDFLPDILASFITKIRPDFTLGVAYPNGTQLEFTADPWHVMTDTASTFYGLSTDLPIVADWTATGVKRIGVFRNGTWILDSNGDGVIDAGDQTVVFGQAGDIPVVGDWRGTGHIALGLYRQGTFILDLSGHLSGVPTGLSDATFSGFGLSTDIPIAADWSGSGTAKVGVFRNGTWLVDYNGVGAASQTYSYGQAGDIPVVGDWDSAGGPAKIGVYRSGIWILNYDANHVLTTPGKTELSVGFGFAGFTPLVF